MIPYSHNIRYTHQHYPICIERQYASCKFEVNTKYQYMDKIPLIRYLVGILKETINPIDTQFINNESHRHITYQGRNVIIRLPNTASKTRNTCQSQANYRRNYKYPHLRKLQLLRMFKVYLCQPHTQYELP